MSEERGTAFRNDPSSMMAFNSSRSRDSQIRCMSGTCFANRASTKTNNIFRMIEAIARRRRFVAVSDGEFTSCSPLVVAPTEFQVDLVHQAGCHAPTLRPALAQALPSQTDNELARWVALFASTVGGTVLSLLVALFAHCLLIT